MLSIELQNQLNTFNAKYSVNFDLEKMETTVGKYDPLKDFQFTQESAGKANAENYYKTLKKVMLDSLTAKTKIASGGDYNLDNFNFVRFMNDFEDLVAQKHKELKEPRERKPFENMKFDQFLSKVEQAARPYNQTVYGVWAHKILDKKDSLSYRELKAVSDNAIHSIESSLDNGNDTYSRKDLANIVYAKEAMERVRQSRTRWWKFWHMYDNYQENKYLEALTKKVNEYAEKKYPVSEILENTKSELLKNAYNSQIKSSEVDKGERMMEILKREEEKNRVESNVAKQMEKVIANPDTKDELAEDILKALPQGGFANGVKKMFLKNNILPEMLKKVQECNKSYDDSISRRLATPEVQMLYIVEAVFDKAFPMPTTLGYLDDKDKIVAAQVITDVVLKKLSPAALDPNRLGQFANGYVVNNANAYSNITGLYAHEELMIEAKEAYNAMMVDKVQVPEANPDQNLPKVEPVQPSAPVVNSPIVGKN